jgi:PAS domain S-box-containing protein
MSGEPELNRLKQELERARRELSSYKVAAAQVGTHLTEISRLNQEISRSQREIDLILKTTSDAMRLVDLDFNIIWVNAAMEQFCGSDSPTLKKKKCHDVIRSEKCGTDACLLNRVLKKNQPISEEVTIKVNGLERQAITVASPFHNEEGEIIGILEDFIDITTSKQAEDALRESEEKYRNIFEAAGDIILLLDTRGRILDANHKLLTVGGYQREEIIGKRITKLIGIIAPKSMPIIVKNFIKRMAGKTSSTYEVQLLTKDGDVRDVEISATVIRRDGKIVADLAILRDITKRKKYEGELLKIQKLESVGVLAGGIAHDFNNLLTAIVANISLVRTRIKPDDPNHKILSEAEKACFFSKDLTQQLLTFSRGGEPVKQVISVAELTEEAVRFSLRGSNVTAAFSFSPDLWPVMVDAGQLRQVINNLTINADQAMPEGGTIAVSAENITLTAGERSPLPGGNYIKISVADEGMGLRGETLSKIFDPFFSTKIGGSGLGLAISYSIVKNHGGHIIAEPKDGPGTKFSVFLPATGLKLREKDSPRQPPSPTGGRILVMDDEPLVARVTCRILKQFGYQADHVPDGEATIEAYTKARNEGRPYTAIIMDLTIPGRMGGKQAMVKLKKIDPDVKTIVSSGYSTDPVMANYQEYGFSGVLPKPYRLDDLRNVLSSIIGSPARGSGD